MPEIKMGRKSEKGGNEEKAVGGAGGGSEGSSVVDAAHRGPFSARDPKVRGGVLEGTGWETETRMLRREVLAVGDTYLPGAGVNERLRKCW